MIKTLLVPGLDGSPAPHWQDWWAATDPTALMVDLPDPAHPVPEAWEAELAGMVLQHPGAVLVGHSLGAVLIARLIAKWPQIEVSAALLVAPADTRGARRIGHFDTPDRHPLPVPTTLVASRNDPWMRYERTAELAAAWGANLVDLGAVGHINLAAGFGPWPLGKALRDQLLARKPRQKRGGKTA
ncbi:RBBP9/YdeN family alpha/beta hydrolase [Rhodobacter lacus]|uniref:RBBP9/YdeN family alpha/beta hydrolase n=1 Tax=Rhodobacter lacus TaxID=1641972 RepID=A0ABW5A9D1_9RHOB